MGKIKSLKRIYGGFFRAGVQNAMAYRASFLGFFIGQSLYCVVMYFIWKAVFMASGEAAFLGFSMTDMTLYVFLSNIVGFLTSTDATQNLAEEIRDGNIIMRMIKPINVDFSLLFMELGNKVMILTCVFVPVMLAVEIYRYVALGTVAFSIVTLIQFAVSVILSYLLAFYLNLLFGYLAFFLMNIWGFDILKGAIINFFSGAIIPLAFFPGAMRTLFEQLPFASIVYIPTMIYMGKYQGRELLFVFAKQVIWLGVFVFICRLVWKWAQKRLAVQGG